jgi:hypothetical protein
MTFTKEIYSSLLQVVLEYKRQENYLTAHEKQWMMDYLKKLNSLYYNSPEPQITPKQVDTIDYVYRKIKDAKAVSTMKKTIWEVAIN